jgi:hypothetical protein
VQALQRLSRLGGMVPCLRGGSTPAACCPHTRVPCARPLLELEVVVADARLSVHARHELVTLVYWRLWPLRHAPHNDVGLSLSEVAERRVRCHGRGTGKGVCEGVATVGFVNRLVEEGRGLDDSKRE